MDAHRKSLIQAIKMAFVRGTALLADAKAIPRWIEQEWPQLDRRLGPVELTEHGQQPGQEYSYTTVNSFVSEDILSIEQDGTFSSFALSPIKTASSVLAECARDRCKGLRAYVDQRRIAEIAEQRQEELADVQYEDLGDVYIVRDPKDTVSKFHHDWYYRSKFVLKWTSTVKR